MAMIHTKEHYDLMNYFEKEFKQENLNREPKEMWSKGIIYQDGAVNNLFKAYRSGCALGKIL